MYKVEHQFKKKPGIEEYRDAIEELKTQLIQQIEEAGDSIRFYQPLLRVQEAELRLEMSAEPIGGEKDDDQSETS
jgi:CRISPR/Cas system-associated endoribonuclease Cas2